MRSTSFGVLRLLGKPLFDEGVQPLAALFTEGEVVLDGLLEGLLHLIRRTALESDHVAGVADLAVKDAGVLVEPDDRLVVPVPHDTSVPRRRTLPGSLLNQKTRNMIFTLPRFLYPPASDIPSRRVLLGARTPSRLRR